VLSNQLSSLPPELGLLTNLKTLNVRLRQSRQMDLDLTAVSRFQASSNQLTSLPTKSAS
jgi:Leucine-rich repeat (LRR) protein